MFKIVGPNVGIALQNKIVNKKNSMYVNFISD